MQEFFKIGLIVKPQGIRGELKVMPLTDDANRFYNLKQVTIDDVVYKVLSVRLGDGAVFLALSGIADRNSAELMRGKFLVVDRENAVKPATGTYFVADIIGCTVVTETGKTVGEVTDVTEAKTDIFTLKRGAKVLRFPFLKDLVLSVDVEKRLITVKEQRLNEVCVYED